jgi:hypothetical protein
MLISWPAGVRALSFEFETNKRVSVETIENKMRKKVVRPEGTIFPSRFRGIVATD